MITTPDGVALYTQEDVDSIKNGISELLTQRYEAGYKMGMDTKSARLRNTAIEHFREIYSGAMDKDEVLEAFNALAGALGWDTVDSLAMKWTVSVDYNGSTIGEFTVEADDEDSAISELQDNLEISDVEISFVLNYNGDECSESINTTYDFDSSDLDFTAYEQ